MTLTVRTLRTDDTITTRSEVAPRYRKAANALAVIGSRLRDTDPTVVACRADEITPALNVPCWTWMGHYNDVHIAVIAAREREGRNDW